MEVRLLDFLLIFSLLFIVEGNLYVSTDSRIVSEGTRATFTCYSTDLGDQNIFSTGGRVVWSRDPRYSSSLQQVAQWTLANNAETLLTEPQDAPRFEIQGGLDSHTEINLNLVIRQTTKADQGKYSCILYSGSGEKISESEKIPLTVKYPPADHFPFCTASPYDVGSDVNLLCKSENTAPASSVQWYKDNRKAADGFKVGDRTISEYRASLDELNSQFECRVVYDDDAGIQVERSCVFSRPYVAIVRETGFATNDETLYRAFAHSNPPFVDDIACSLESSTGTRVDFEIEFPGYGLVTIGPVAAADNGTDLVCQATNVFGSGLARMPVYSDRSQSGETTLPSVVTNYMPNEEGTLEASIWPKSPSVTVGENVTFVCSYTLELHSASRARVAIRWSYNDILVDDTLPRYTITENSLHVKQVTNEDDSSKVTCSANLIVEDTPVVNIPASQSTTHLLVKTDTSNMDCLQAGGENSPIQSQRKNSSFLYSSSFLICISALAAIGWILCVVFILTIVMRNRKQKKLGLVHTRRASSQMTYRAGTNTMSNGVVPGTIPMTNGLASGSIASVDPTSRALPAQPSTNQIRNGSATAPTTNLHVGVPIETSRPELAYQEMVGNTGLSGSRNGNHGNSVRSNGAISSGEQPMLVPAPNGGFLPPEMLPSNSSSNAKCQGPDGAELNYEDLDCMGHHDQQAHTRRALGNDYQTSISNTPYQHQLEQQELLPHYANS